jgi:hypothetical protein
VPRGVERRRIREVVVQTAERGEELTVLDRHIGPGPAAEAWYALQWRANPSSQMCTRRPRVTLPPRAVAGSRR